MLLQPKPVFVLVGRDMSFFISLPPASTPYQSRCNTSGVPFPHKNESRTEHAQKQTDINRCLTDTLNQCLTDV